MSLQSYYEESYQSEVARIESYGFKEELISQGRPLFNYVVESKNRFIPNKDWSDLKILEAGSGRGAVSLLLKRLGANVSLLDFSAEALKQSEELFRSENTLPETFLGDVTHPDLNLTQKFDVIVDSHLLHCISLDPDRASYFKFILDHLEDDGIFVAETMVHRKKIFIPDGFMLDGKNVLWQRLGNWVPVRKIIDSLDLETELQSVGFKISYFYYYGQFGFVPHRNFLDLPTEILPAAVRMVVQKNNL